MNPESKLVRKLSELWVRVKKIPSVTWPLIKRSKKTIIKIIFVASTITGFHSYFHDVFYDISNKSLLSAVYSVFDKLIKKEEETQGLIKEVVGKQDNIDCNRLEDWESDSSTEFQGQYIILDKDKEIGTARLSGSFSNSFNLDIRFSPGSIEKINTTVALKDLRDNELSLTIGDNDLQKIRFTSKKLGELFSENPYFEKNLITKIDPKQEIKLRISTSWKTDTTTLTANIGYYYFEKPGIQTVENILDIDIPSDFLDELVYLNIGIRKGNETEIERKLKLIKCEISEIVKF